MTDLERLKELLNSWEVPYMIPEDHPYAERGEVFLVVGETMDYRNESSDKVDGYNGFFTAYVFDQDEAFLRMGAWE